MSIDFDNLVTEPTRPAVMDFVAVAPSFEPIRDFLIAYGAARMDADQMIGVLGGLEFSDKPKPNALNDGNQVFLFRFSGALLNADLGDGDEPSAMAWVRAHGVPAKRASVPIASELPFTVEGWELTALNGDMVFLSQDLAAMRVGWQ